MIEGDEAVIKHEHRIIEADLVAQALGKTLDQANHVVTEISDGSGNQRWQAGEPHGTKALDPLAEERDGIALFPDQAFPVFEDARAIPVPEDFFRMRAGKRIPRDFFASFNAFEEKRVARALRDAQVGTHGRQQIRGKYVVDRDEVSLLRETLELLEVGLHHG